MDTPKGFPCCNLLHQAYAVLAPVSSCYPPSKGRSPTRYSPVRHFTHPPKGTFSFDLHVLGTPPALILSQDQTLKLISGPCCLVVKERCSDKTKKGPSRKPFIVPAFPLPVQPPTLGFHHQGFSDLEPGRRLGVGSRLHSPGRGPEAPEGHESGRRPGAAVGNLNARLPGPPPTFISAQHAPWNAIMC